MSFPSSKHRNIISLTSHFNHGAHHASKAKHKRNHENEQSASSKTAKLPVIQCDYLMLKDVAATGGLKVLSMYVRTCGHGMSTVVDIEGPTDTFATMWAVKNVEFPRTLRRHSAV